MKGKWTSCSENAVGKYSIDVTGGSILFSVVILHLNFTNFVHQLPKMFIEVPVCMRL